MENGHKFNQHRIVLHVKTDQVTVEMIGKSLEEELGVSPIQVQDYQIEPGPFFQQVEVQSGSRFVPITIIKGTFTKPEINA